MGDLDVDIQVFEPTKQYQNVAKRAGVEKLTPARALIAELVRRYWVLGMECSLLEIQKLAWFLERAIEHHNPGDNPLNLQFAAHKYGPYANRLDHLLNNLDGSYLHSEKRISDADPLDVIWFGDERKAFMKQCLGATAGANQAGASPAASNKQLAQQEKMKTCNAEAKTKALKGDERKAFMKECLSNKG